jgi:hypothetical protein
MNSFCFASQSAAEATGRCYVQIFGTRDAGPPFADVTGYYDFTAVKLAGVWRFGRWIHKVDQASV